MQGQVFGVLADDPTLQPSLPTANQPISTGSQAQTWPSSSGWPSLNVRAKRFWPMILITSFLATLKTAMTVRHDRLLHLLARLTRMGGITTQVEVPLEDLKRSDANFYLPHG